MIRKLDKTSCAYSTLQSCQCHLMVIYMMDRYFFSRNLYPYYIVSYYNYGSRLLGHTVRRDDVYTVIIFKFILFRINLELLKMGDEPGLFRLFSPLSPTTRQTTRALQVHTVRPRSSDPFYVVTYYIKWATTSWTYST